MGFATAQKPLVAARSWLVVAKKGARSLQSSLYKKIYKQGIRFIGQTTFVTYIDQDYPTPQLGITVTRKYGNAVKRNRFKRLAREAFRHTNLPALAYNISPRGPYRPLTCHDVLEDLKQLADAL